MDSKDGIFSNWILPLTGDREPWPDLARERDRTRTRDPVSNV